MSPWATLQLTLSSNELMLNEMQMIVNCVRTGAAPVVTGLDGLWSVRMCLAAQRSVDERRPVAMSEVM